MTTKFTTDHEWINIEDHDAAVVGITLHAQDALGDVVFVDLPAVGRTFLWALIRCMAELPIALILTSNSGGQTLPVVLWNLFTTGIQVPPGRPALLAQRIRQLLQHPMLLEAFSVAAADRAKSRYSWDRIAHETLAAYDSALVSVAA